MTVLLQDKANLESRVNIFVRVLQMRDEQIEQIRSGQRVRIQSNHLLLCQISFMFIIAYFFFVLADSGYKRQRRGS